MKRSGFLNVFNPHIIQFSEQNENLTFKVKIEDSIIFVQSKIPNATSPFSTKYQLNEEINYINTLTGEKYMYNYNLSLTGTKDLLEKLKPIRNKSDIVHNCPTEEFKAKSGEKSMHLILCSKVQNTNNTGLFNDFYYDGKLILEKRIVDKSTKEEKVLKLVSIHTINSNSGLKANIAYNRELVLKNESLGMDSIILNTVIPDVYFKNVKDEKIYTLNIYKGNGKYLLIDFWGTWCKPCLASIPHLATFYEAYSDKIDLLSMDYKDMDIDAVKNKIKDTGMYWDQGIATEKVNKILNPESYFPGILLFDDEMRLVLRAPAKIGLEDAKKILDQR